MSESVEIFDPAEIQAVKDGTIEGDVYADGAVYANAESLARWRNEQPIASLEASAGILP